MKKSLLPILILLTTLCNKPLFAQQQNDEYTGAKANLRHYKALYVLNTNDDKRIDYILRKMQNAFLDPRLKGKLSLELIAYGDGVRVFEKNSPFEKQLKELKKMGVILAECENTVMARHIDKNTLFPFTSYVPSATGEIIIRGSDEWVVMQP